VHELGHLVCGKISGYEFLSFRLGNLLWTKNSDGKILLSKNKPGVVGILGQCLMIPPADEKNFKFVLYNLGGGLFNIVLFILFSAWFICIENEAAAMFIFGIAVGQLLLGAVNLIPNGKKAPIPNDGANIREALKSADAAHAFYIMFKHNAESSNGKHLGDYSETDFKVSENADVNNYLVAMLVLYEASRLEELGKLDESYREILRLENADLQVFYRRQVLLNLIFHELVYFDGEHADKAKKRFEENRKDKVLMRNFEMEHVTTLPFKAAKLAFIDGDFEQARDCIERCGKQLHTLQNPGIEYQIELMCSRMLRVISG
jgi:hypothetical protein